jgi:hypothetical protein
LLHHTGGPGAVQYLLEIIFKGDVMVTHLSQSLWARDRVDHGILLTGMRLFAMVFPAEDRVA